MSTKRSEVIAEKIAFTLLNALPERFSSTKTKSPKSKAAKAVPSVTKEDLIKLIEPVVAEEDIAKYADDLQSYSFLFPKEQMNQASKAFDECGDIQVTLHRDAERAAVHIEKLAPDVSGEDKRTELVQDEEHEEAPHVPFPDLGTGQAEEIVDAPKPAKINRTVAILLATNRDFFPSTVMSILGSWKAAARLSSLDEATVSLETDTLIAGARNTLATNFVNRPEKPAWAFFLDSDILAPIGLPGWFHAKTDCSFSPEFAGLNALEVLTSGPEKIVSAVYRTRDNRGLLVNSAGLAPKNEREREIAKRIKGRGPSKERVAVEWSGFGCIAVHRSVFLDVMEKMPNLAPKKEGEPWNFFTGDMSNSEDVAFLSRAKQCGHQTYLDLSVFVGHVGRSCFMP